jgi:GNAT superfamily N-acetyltransferase
VASGARRQYAGARSGGRGLTAADAALSLVGCGGWNRERPGTGDVEPGTGHLRHFATHPAWTKRGIGRAIYARCEADARAAGIRVLECYASLNAEGFYAALGFERIRSITLDLAPGIGPPAVLMRRRLDRPAPSPGE